MKGSEKTMKELPLATISQLPGEGVVAVDWKDTCGNLLREDHKEQIGRINRELEEIGPKKLLIDMTNCRYVFTPKTNKWFDNLLFQLFGNGEAEAIAFVVPANLFTQILFEAAEQSLHGGQTETRYFRERSHAREWLESMNG